MIISHIYSVAMKYLYVQPKGNEKPVRVTADKAEENESKNELAAYLGGQVVGRFTLTEIVGWWLEES